MPTYLDQFLSSAYLGYTGSQGIQGIQGVQGTQGAQGTQGTIGAQGTQGTVGQQGIQGTQGTQGIQGIQGTQGTTGAQGTQGTDGQQGTQGTDGQQGIQGITGQQGVQGVQGIQGNIGGAGIQGTGGSQGTAGQQGIQGLQGIQGQKGTPTDLKTSLAYLNNAANTTNAGWQKVPLDATSIDEGLWWDSGNKNFKVTQNGWYQINGRARTNTGAFGALAIGINGSNYQAIGGDTGTAVFAIGGSLSVYLTTTDTVDLRVYATTVTSYTVGFFDNYLEITGPLQAGPQGIQGNTGQQGIQGIQGIDGAFASQGIQGTTGAQGIQGITGGSTTFLGLTDTPDSYTGQAGKIVTVKSDESGIEFGTQSKWEIIFNPTQNEPPTANFATLDTRNSRPVLEFDTTTQESAIWTGMIPVSYSGANLSVTIVWAADTATTGTVGWDVALERTDASSLDIDADSFGSATTVTAVTVPGTSGMVIYSTATITTGANTDSLAAGELFRLRVRRDVANDTAAGDAQLLAVRLKEV